MENTFHVLDYIIFIFVIIFSFCIGIYHAVFKKPNTTGQFLMASRKLKVLPTAISLLISFISAINILGNAAETYFYGINYFFVVPGYIFAALMARATFVPMLYPLKITSINEVWFYIRAHFFVFFFKKKAIRILFSTCFIASYFLTRQYRFMEFVCHNGMWYKYIFSWDTGNSWSNECKLCGYCVFC